LRSGCMAIRSLWQAELRLSLTVFLPRRKNRLFCLLLKHGQKLSHRETVPEVDQIIDSLPVMLASHGHSYSAKVARERANVGFCAAKKLRFHGVRLHLTAARRNGRLPLPTKVWLVAASHHDSKAVKEQTPVIAADALFGDLAYLDKELIALLATQNTQLLTPIKKPKDGNLTEKEEYHNRLVSKFRQPIESLFNWIIEKTNIQKASKVRSTDALLIHCWGKLAVAFFLLVFNY
jgi:Transposase DDE domain